jgi:hypothetical protein
MRNLGWWNFNQDISLQPRKEGCSAHTRRQRVVGFNETHEQVTAQGIVETPRETYKCLTYDPSSLRIKLWELEPPHLKILNMKCVYKLQWSVRFRGPAVLIDGLLGRNLGDLLFLMMGQEPQQVWCYSGVNCLKDGKQLKYKKVGGWYISYVSCWFLMASGVQDYECLMKECSPILIWSHLVNFNGALCLEFPRGILTNKEKNKDRQITVGAMFIFRFAISLVPSMHFLQGRCDKPNSTLKTNRPLASKLASSISSCSTEHYQFYPVVCPRRIISI